MRRRVAITGLGAICSLGVGIEEVWSNVIEGRTVVTPIPANWRNYADYKSSVWAPLPSIDFERFGIGRIERLQNDVVTLLGLSAAQQAIEDAGLRAVETDRAGRKLWIHGVPSDRAGVYVGTGIGGVNSCLTAHACHVLSRTKTNLQKEVAALSEKGTSSRLQSLLDKLSHAQRFNPFIVSMLMPNAVSAAIGIKYSLQGANTTFSVACSSGTAAIGHAFRAIRANVLDFALAGGAEYLYDEYGSIFHGFDVANTLVQDCTQPMKCNRPFDKGRSGFLFSEGGAAVLVLEELESALRRGATVIAEISGYSESFDAHSMMSLAPDGAAIDWMIRECLRDAGLTSVQYVNSHGTGTAQNDEIEADVIGRTLGSDVFVNSTKSLIGHTLGASGAIEAAVTARTISRGTLHPSRNLDNPIAELNFIRERKQVHVSTALSQSFGFGGHNAALAFLRFANP